MSKGAIKRLEDEERTMRMRISLTTIDQQNKTTTKDVPLSTPLGTGGFKVSKVVVIWQGGEKKQPETVTYTSYPKGFETEALGSLDPGMIPAPGDGGGQIWKVVDQYDLPTRQSWMPKIVRYGKKMPARSYWSPKKSPRKKTKR